MAGKLLISSEKSLSSRLNASVADRQRIDLPRRHILIVRPAGCLISLAKKLTEAPLAERHALTERAIKVAQVLRPLGTKPLSMQQARVASKLLNVH